MKTSGNKCINFCQKNEPILSIVLKLDQGKLETLTDTLSDYLIDSLETPESLQKLAQTDTTWITKWIYAALACLQLPLDPEVHNCLRMIAKSSIQIRNHLKSIPCSSSESESSLFPWNLLIVIVARNFEQFDLLSL